MQTYTVLKVHPEDSVAVAIRPLSQGEVVEVAGQIGRASCRERV